MWDRSAAVIKDQSVNTKKRVGCQFSKMCLLLPFVFECPSPPHTHKHTVMQHIIIIEVIKFVLVFYFLLMRGVEMSCIIYYLPVA